MTQAIELAKAIAWPVAGIIISLVILLIVWRVTASPGDLSFDIKDWFKLSRKAAPSATKAIQDVAPTEPSESEPQSSAQTLAEVAEEEISKAKSHIFWVDDNSNNIEDSFLKFKETMPYADDPEFWESLYVDRRRELEIGQEEIEFRLLASSNVNWVWPLIFLIRRYVRFRDASSAERTLAEALARSSDKRHWVLREGVSLYFQLFGAERALEFCRHHLLAGAADKEVSEMFKAISDKVGNPDDAFSNAILREIAAAYGGDDKDLLFKLAYSYGSLDSFGAISYQRYSRIGIYDEKWSSSPNNMGVVVGASSSALQRDYYEQAMSIGSGIAFANLARQLISDGYVRRAEIILENAPDDSSDSGALALADARAKAKLARNDLEKEKESFNSYAKDQDYKYSALIFSAFDFFKSEDNSDSYGTFSSSDRTLTVITDQEGADCIYKIGDKTLSGRFSRKPLCFEGNVSGGSGLLNYQFKRILLVQIKRDLVRAIVWPEQAKQSDTLRVVDLNRIPSADENDKSLAINGPAELLEDNRQS